MIAAHDGTIEALRSRRQMIGTPIALADDEALACAISKERTYALADQLSIGRPRTTTVESARELKSALHDAPLPLVVKPSQSWAATATGGVRLQASVVTTRSAAETAAARILAAGVRVLLQEWVGGRREAVSLFRRDGRIHARFAQVAFRMSPPLGGSSVVRESVELPADATIAAERLIEAMRLDGYSEVEFRRNAAGEPLLMEVNPRLSASVEVAVRSGVDFPRAVYRWAAGDEAEEVTGYRVGVRMRWLGGDIHWLWRTLRSQGMPDSLPALQAGGLFLRDFFRPAAYDYLALSDPLPAVVASGQFVSGGVGTIARHVHRMLER
ncbi:MAG: ATP-grasp domain-containing protein [Gaiellaceae bacterium]